MSTTAKEATVFTLHTYNYRHFNPTVGTAVQTSIGSPRWPLRYALDFRVSELMPTRAMLKLPYEQYADRYLAQLEDVGTDHLAARFQLIASAAGDPRLVLLCFEDLRVADNWCHRTLFAQFWQARTGQAVTELGLADPSARSESIDR